MDHKSREKKFFITVVDEKGRLKQMSLTGEQYDQILCAAREANIEDPTPQPQMEWVCALLSDCLVLTRGSVSTQRSPNELR